MCYLDRFKVFRIGRQFVEQIDLLSACFEGDATLRNQIRRSSQSVLLNIGEGLGRRLPGEKRRAYTIAHGEVHETRAALVIASLRGHISSAQLDRADDLADHTGALLWKLIQRFRE